MPDPSYILTPNTLTLMYDGVHTCSSTHRNWDVIKGTLKEKKWDALVELMKPVNALRSYARVGDIEVTEYSINYRGEPLRGALVDRILQMKVEGFDIDPMVKFLGNLMDNPSYRSREQLYTFLEHNNMPITEDGCFMAYKRVNSDFTDVHSGQFDNRPGQIVCMPRSQVDDDPNNTCSAGLHVCSREYLRNFSGAKLVACKVNPANVVSVPTDYNFTKMRVCEYETVEELPLSLVTDNTEHWNRAVYSVPSEDDADALDDPDYYCDDPDFEGYND